MSTRPLHRWKPVPDAIRVVADSDPTWCKKNGTPNVAAVARASGLSKSALNRVMTGRRPWAGGDTVLQVSAAVAEARGITIDEAQRLIFQPVEVAVPA